MAWLRARALTAGEAWAGHPLGALWAATTAYAGLFKSRVVALLLMVALATAVVAADGLPSAERLLLLALSAGLAASGAAALNHYLDRDIDGRMRRTQGRPLPSGRIAQPRRALVAGLASLSLGLLLSLPLGPLTTLFLALGAVIYVPIYTLWLKRSHPLNIVIGGGAGSCMALAGWAAAGGGHPLTASLLALLIFLWTPCHFWSYALVHREDYRKARIPMLPVSASPAWAIGLILAHSALVVALSLALAYPLGAFGVVYLAGAAASALLPLWAAGRLACRPGRDAAYLAFKASGAYLGLLFLFILADVLL